MFCFNHFNFNVLNLNGALIFTGRRWASLPSGKRPPGTAASAWYIWGTAKAILPLN